MHTTTGSNTDEETSYPNYNVRVYLGEPEMDTWCKKHRYPVRKFLRYDGGGPGGYIFEFTKLKHAMHFMTRFGVPYGRMWIEKAPGERFP